ncbi:aromatic ring-hydroxylating oxygenase subunit alpha [Pseudochryseolinea flava]|uniref:Aromatic ring-hydroxylating dioxygenase subunit alpha n=1 Tax=Pseudochryseolinea flava TaxID=2059302 RepID=A0A364XWL6_9BACT|nr:aromatic ring-hydroxylating dioxygenase subunit alpha [Pseudochryseolinea flava]RAV98604.1 aromatic ring-hydroxylating dioxygenase subunit alpha [Pseudochryseolinea flava]
MPKFDIHPDIAKATTIPTDFYLQTEYFEYTQQKLFPSTWQFMGDTDRVKEAGWVTPLTFLENFVDEPLLLAHDQDNAIRCLSNVCTHRANLIIERPCKTKDLRCKYHGRRFKLDGKFLSMPEFKEVENFPAETDNLTNVPLSQWGKFLFTSLSPLAPAESFFKEMQTRMSWLPLQDFHFRPELSRDYIVNAHWALYCENYLEGFHIPFVHAGLNAVIDYGNYTTELYPYASLQLGLAKDDDDVFDLPENSPDYGKKVAGYYFWIFPNMMFNFYPWGLSINVVKPISPSQSKVSFLSYVWDENKLRQGAGANLHQVEMEDEDVVQQVQKGIRSRFYHHGRYSAKMEKGTHHFHRLLAKLIDM